jgi:PAS domain-containing protein
MLALTGVIFVALLITLYLIKREQETLITTATQLQFNKETASLISLKTETLKSVVYDYTYWDEFIEKIYKSDTNWFSNNITTILKSFHTDYVCVYDTSFNVIHEAASEGFNSRNISSLQTLKKLKQSRFLDYFMVTGDGLLEVSAATIHPENDPTHATTKPYGYLFVAKSWNQKIFIEMTTLTGAKIIPVLSTDSVINNEPFSIVSDHKLLGLNKEVVARIHFSRPAVSLKLFRGLSQYMIIFMLASILSTLLIFHFSFRKWINKPLKLVTQILETSKLSLVDELKQCKGEFKAIATLFNDFILQKDELTAAKDKAIENEQTYRSLFDHMLNAFMYCKMIFEDNNPVDFVYIDVNQVFETQTNLTNVSGKRVSEMIPGIYDSDKFLFEKFGKVAQTGIPEQFEYYINALKIWISASVYSTEKDYFVAIFDVITERKLAEIKIREIGLHYQAIIENAPDGIVLLNEKGDFKFISPSAKKIFGYEINDSISANPASLTHLRIYLLFFLNWVKCLPVLHTFQQSNTGLLIEMGTGNGLKARSEICLKIRL